MEQPALSLVRSDLIVGDAAIPAKEIL